MDKNKNKEIKGGKDTKDTFDTKEDISFIKNNPNNQSTNMIQDTKDTLDTNDTDKKNTKSIKSIKSIPYHTTCRALGKDALNEIILVLINSNPLSYEGIAKKIKNTKNYVKLVINRKKQFFEETKKQGKEKQFKLSLFAEDYITEKVRQFELTQIYLRKKETKKEEMRSETESIIVEAQQIKQSKNFKREGKSLIFDFEKLSEISPIFTEALMSKPEEVLEILESVFEIKYTIRIKNLPKSSNINIENLRSENLNKLISIEARVVSISPVRSQVVNAKFECPSCGTVISVLQVDKKFREPSRCSCGRKGNFKLLKKTLIDVSRIILEDLQERTDNPHTQRINSMIKGFLTSPEKIKIFTPGNEIKCSGVLKEVIQITKGGSRSIISDYVFEILDSELFEQEIDISNFSPEEIKDIEEVSARIDINGLHELTPSFAPTIVKANKIKEGIMLQMCCSKNNPSKLVRNKPNILLIGDPGTAKSMLCRFLVDINPESRKCSGGGSSAVGITASVVKEEEIMGGYRIEPGALVLAKDILFIDELNNLSDDDKPKLQDAMSEQQVVINKASIHISLKVTAGILATANPTHGNFKEDKYNPISYQFNLPPQILNRFDLVFLFRDINDENTNNLIAQRMLERDRGEIEVTYSKEFLKKFFIYVKNFKEPKIPKDLDNSIKQVYSKMKKNNPPGNSKINPRTFESLMRLIKAYAKCRLSSHVQEKDIVRVLDIFKESYYFEKEFKEDLIKEVEVLKK